MRLLLIYISIGLMLGLSQMQAQVLDSENSMALTLEDGTGVMLYGRATSLSDEASHEYYYLPTKLRLSKKQDGTPQFLFIKYASEQNGKASGAILHLLMEYGLSTEEETELAELAKKKNPLAKIMGVAQVAPADTNSVRIISATLANSRTRRSLVFTGQAPTFPGNKIALAANLDAEAAQLLDASFQKSRSIADLSISLSYTYPLKFPAAKGYIIEDWSKVDSLDLFQKGMFTRTGSIERGWFHSSDNRAFTYDEMHELYDKMEENKVIDMRFEELVADERVEKIREMFFQYFLDSFADQDMEARPLTPSKKQKTDMPDIKHGVYFKFNRRFAENVIEKRKQVFNLNYSTTFRHSYQLTENLGTWYDAVRNNPKCVSVILLNDPTFLHRDVNIVLDGTIEEMLEQKELNSINIKLRKTRDAEDAYPFNEDLIVDSRYLGEKNEGSNRLSFTYSKARDSKPEVYEYKLKYSFKGGNTYIPDTAWTKGDWGMLEINPPIYPFNITFESSLEDMEAAEIRNVAIQLRYNKFGEEVETVVNIRTSKGEPFLEKTIFMDKNAKGYAYRLLFYHPEGIMATDWEARFSTGYVYANIPQELVKGDKSFKEELLTAGKAIRISRGDGKVVKEEDQISGDPRFADLFEK